jgi:hypothetical protein
MSESSRKWLFRKRLPEGRLMIRCTTYLTLAACVMAVPSAMAQGPGLAPQNQPRPTGVIRGSRTAVGSPNLTPTALSAPRDNPYSGSSYAGDGYGGSGGAGGYGRGGSTGGGDSAGAASSGGGSAQALEVILKASGVPNQNGRVAWPPAFRLLRADSLTQQLEGQLQLAAEQVTAGGVNPQLPDEIRLNVEALRRLLRADKEWRFSLPLAVYEDAERFLQKLKRTPQILAASAPAGRPEATAP